MKTFKNRHGLSLIEILVTVAIIAVLASITIGIVSHIDNQSNEKEIASTFALLDGALGEYYDYWKRFPDPNLPLYGQLRSTPGANEYMEGINANLIHNDPNGIEQIYDPWGKPLRYSYIQGNTYPNIVSVGPDNIFGTNDDIQNK